ncbi:hypothetical protein BJV78DRAFT_268819 [Lactifluus subvellereus]|nr:hypothetical protein BJV78DRAFT_268819 [Lactifluus subvellereus]
MQPVQDSRGSRKGASGKERISLPCAGTEKRSDGSFYHISSVLFLPCQDQTCHTQKSQSPRNHGFGSFFFFPILFPSSFALAPATPFRKKGRRCGYGCSHRTYSPTRSAVDKGMLSSFLPPVVWGGARNLTVEDICCGYGNSPMCGNLFATQPSLRRCTSFTNACPTEQGNEKSPASVVYLNIKISNSSVPDNFTTNIPGIFIDIIHAHANLITMPPSNVHPQQ